MRILGKSLKITLADDIFFAIPDEEPFSLDVLIIQEYVFLYKLAYDKKLGLISLLLNPDVKSFVDAILNRFENYKLIKRQGEREFIKGENYHLAYDLGGYTAYLEFRKRELNFPKFQRKINRWLIAATILSGISPIITTIVNNKMYIPPPTEVKIPSQPVQHTVVTLDSLSLVLLRRSMLKDTVLPK